MPVATHRRCARTARAAVLATGALLVAALLVGSVGHAGAQTPSADDATITALRAEAERSSTEYFDALGRSQELALSIADLEGQLPGMPVAGHVEEVQRAAV